MCLVLADYSGARGKNRVVHHLTEAAKAVWLGALAMLPNVFPIVVVFGAMGMLGILADIGSAMTACVALGIAVDDTLHFLLWYRRETRRGATPVIAIQHSFQHCGRAMVQTTVVCGFGLLVFSLSGFVPTQRFAWLMLTLLSTALLADLVFLPAILASPLGSLLAAKNAPPQPTSATDAA
jgi:predicted RND superfamily exporter protein